jgi:PhnB protein
MTTQLNPYLMLPGTAKPAIAFYADVFGGTPEVMTFADMAPPGEAAPDGVMHAYLPVPGGSLMISDLPPGSEPEPISGIAISLSGDDEPVLRGWFERLSAAGVTEVELSPQAWGDTFGMCTDQFGVKWMVNIGAPRS